MVSILFGFIANLDLVIFSNDFILQSVLTFTRFFCFSIFLIFYHVSGLRFTTLILYMTFHSLYLFYIQTGVHLPTVSSSDPYEIEIFKHSVRINFYSFLFFSNGLFLVHHHTYELRYACYYFLPYLHIFSLLLPLVYSHMSKVSYGATYSFFYNFFII